jgi:type I restriction enzyme M protein
MNNINATKKAIQKFVGCLNFVLKENEKSIYYKIYTGKYTIEIDSENEIINYGDKIKFDSKTTLNFSQPENFVVLECVDRLLEKGYRPQNIILEKTYPAGHGTSGRLDICVNRNDGTEYLLIECKTYGKEFDKAFARMKKDGGQLFTYFKFSNKPDIIMLYASELADKGIVYRNEIVKIEDDYRTGGVKDFYEKWNKLTKDNGVFDEWAKPYNFESKALTIDDLVEIKQEDSSFIFNRFLEILRHNVVSDKPNAFNKIFTLFLCKIYDEKVNEGTTNELGFQWIEGVDDDVSFQLRLTDLYKKGMNEFLEKKVTDFSEDEFDKKYQRLFSSNDNLAKELKQEINRIRLEKNNEFAIKEVYDRKSFNENAKVVKEVVELLQKFKVRYTKKQQYLSDFFELLLTTGLKQESGQFFTPVPIAQFIIKSLPIDSMVKAKLQEGKCDDLLPYIIDYAAGSGHFITETMHEIQQQLNTIDTKNLKSEARSFVDTWRIRHFDWALKYIYGIEKDYRLVKVGKVGCYLHGDGLANVVHSDGLASFDYKEYKNKLFYKDENFPKDNRQFDIVVSNPPYSVFSFKNVAREYYTEKDFDLYDNLTDNSSEIECLFVERTKQLLKDDGVAGIILPSSILSNEGIYIKAREIILQYFEIVAITKLGNNTFMATGTNTVVLFLRRRNNYDYQNFVARLENSIKTYQDNTINGIEKPISKYVNYVWENISFDDYVTMLKKEPNPKITEHEIYKEYRKKITAKNEKNFWNVLFETEKEKILYFILAYPQKVVLVKTGEKDAEKYFLGYEFSNRRGSEGIHPIQRGKTIDECTKLFDDNCFNNPEKASTYIYKAFSGDYDFPIHETLKNNILRVRLVDMLTFNRDTFTKNISTAVNKKVKIESKYEQVLLSNALQKIKGSTEKIEKFNIKESGKYPVITQEKDSLINGYSDNKNPVTDLPILLFGDHSCTLKYVDFKFFRGADGTVLLKPNNDFVPKYFYNVLKYIVFDLIENKEKYERHYKYLQNLRIPLPPIEIQQKIVAEIEILEKKEQKIKENIEKLKNDIAHKFNISTVSNHKKLKLGDICEMKAGTFVKIGDIYNDFQEGLYPCFGGNGLRGYTKTYTKEGTYSLIGRQGALCGNVHLVSGKFHATEHALVVTPKIEIDTIWLFHKLVSMNLNKYAAGTAQPGISVTNIVSIQIPVLPLSDQRKIVAKIKKIEAEISKLEIQLLEIPVQKEKILRQYL